MYQHSELHAVAYAESSLPQFKKQKRGTPCVSYCSLALANEWCSGSRVLSRLRMLITRPPLHLYFTVPDAHPNQS